MRMFFDVCVFHHVLGMCTQACTQAHASIRTGLYARTTCDLARKNIPTKVPHARPQEWRTTLSSELLRMCSMKIQKHAPKHACEIGTLGPWVQHTQQRLLEYMHIWCDSLRF